MDILKSIEHEQLKNKIPELKIGNTVKVHVRIKEGNKERIQVFEGIIIKKQGGGVNSTFTVRRISYGVGVEKTFLVHSPMIEKVELVRVGKARRAKLYYLRDRVGKAAKTKEKVGARIENKEIVIKEVLKLMTSSSSPNIIFPEEFTNELTQEDFLISNESQLPALILLSKADFLTLKLYQNYVKSECNFKNVCVVIGIDCSRTINEKSKVIHSLLTFSFINILNILGIPYSIVIFADYKFQYIIKDFKESHSDEIFQRIYDSIIVKRYATKIADACYFIKKKTDFVKENKAIFIISNGLDPKLKFPNNWYNLFNDKKESFGFYFIHSPEIPNKDIPFIENIWKNFKDMTKIELTICKGENILKGDNFLINTFINTIKKLNSNPENDVLHYQPQFPEQIEIIEKKCEKLKKMMMKKMIIDIPIYIQNKYIKSENHKLNISGITVKYNFMVKFIKNIGEDINIINIKKENNFINNFPVINNELMNSIFVPNQPTLYAPSHKGNRLYLLGLINFCLTNGQDNNIWLEKKVGLRRNYRISVIIDSSISCIYGLMGIHSLNIIFNFLKMIYSLQIPYFDLIIATKKNPIVLCSSQESTNCLSISSPIYSALLSILSKSENSSNLYDAITTTVKLQSSTSAKKNYMFILTDGLFEKGYKIKLNKLILNVEELGIMTYGIGLGYYPYGISQIFPKCFWVPESSQIQLALSAFFGNEISYSQEIEEITIESDKSIIEDFLKEFNEKGGIQYKSLYYKLNNTTLYLENFEELLNPDLINEKIKINPKIDKNNTMCKEGILKGLKTLICVFWSKSIAGSQESEWVDYEYLINRYDSATPCLKEAFDYYKVEIEIVTDYEKGIQYLQTGNYYSVWIICGDGSGKLPKGGNANLVGQFVDCTIKFWKQGGALVWWCDNEPLFYEANLFLNRVEFPGGEKTKLRFNGKHLGGKKMYQGDINKNDKGVFNFKRIFEEGKYQRYSLAHNLAIIDEGTTVSYVDDIYEISPFSPFAYDNDGGMSIIFWDAKIDKINGDIIIDGGFTKLFNELNTEGTYRYVQNIIAWTTQFSRRIGEYGENWINVFKVPSFTQEINYKEVWDGFKKRYSNEFDIVYMIDATGSMTNYIKAVKDEALNISNSLKEKFPMLMFNYGCIFYRDPIDDKNDTHELLQLTDNIPSLQEKIGKVKATGGGDDAEDWVGAYKKAIYEIGWREGTKLIIHIADAPAHGKIFLEKDTHDDEEAKLKPLIFTCAEREIKIISFNIGKTAIKCFEYCKKYYEQKKGPLYKIYEFNETSSSSTISGHFKELVIEGATCAAPKKF